MIERMLVFGATTEGGIGEAIAMEGRAFSQYMETPSPGEFDVRDHESTVEWFKAHGPYDAVVYSAGVQYLGMLNNLDMYDIDQIFQVNVVGFINVLQGLVKTQASGRVCAISSLAGRQPFSGSIGYCASKAALNHAIRCAARELKQGWQITGVVPATVAGTQLTYSVDRQVMEIRQWDHDELIKQERDRQPFGRRIHTDEIAQLVLSILTGPMCMTGSVVDIAGGA